MPHELHSPAPPSRDDSRACGSRRRYRLSPERLTSLAQRQTRNADAYDFYLRGVNFSKQRTRSSPDNAYAAVQEKSKFSGLRPRNQNSKRATVHAVALSLGTHISINDLLETPHGVYWVATNGGGVARFNRTDAGGLGGREGWWPEIREPSRFTVIPVGDDAQMTPDLADVGPCIAQRVGRLRHSRRPTSSRYSPTSTMR
jgi:hypothetical protein